MIDVHCHLADEKYPTNETDLIVKRALDAGVQMITNGTGMADSRANIEIAEKFEGVWVCVGLAYERGSDNWEKIKQELIELTTNKKVIGIGEAGLDYYEGIRDDLKYYQQNLLRVHLEVAAQTNLPIQIHNRNADDDLLKILDNYKVKVIMHGYTRGLELMEETLNRGWYISLGGIVVYRNSKRVEKVTQEVPEENLLLETDAPYLAPVRGERNIPENVKIVAEAVAEIRGTTTKHIDEVTTANAKRLFNI